MMGVAVVMAVIVGVAVAVSASDDEPTKRTETADTTERTTTTERDSTPPVVEEPTTSTTAAQADIAAVGPNEWFTYTDGVEVQVTKIERFTPEYDDDPRPDVLVTVTIKNGSSGVLDLTLAQATV